MFLFFGNVLYDLCICCGYWCNKGSVFGYMGLDGLELVYFRYGKSGGDNWDIVVKGEYVG